ncbi:uncharacterized protein LOC129596039 [Paramacrobiotus metropolitanus]|uniref:uncharacterized protein LOC129596039 n=1 Tax=Paramacrobiotus metropolitanus TaxID=2943436 RepID=UPI0024464A86|nr:uncharacterized protein LOC129596039 [Paramacrobiotus metropolitanus]
MPTGIYQSNTADVLGEDGLFRCGRVVDVTDNGLFVDLLCPERRRQFIPFDRIYRSTESRRVHQGEFHGGRAFTKPVEVLMRDSPSGPWTWFPAEIVNINRGICHTACHVAVVSWRNGTSCSDFVPIERVRYRLPSEFWMRLGRTHDVPLPLPLVPARSWWGDSDTLREMVNCVQSGEFVKGSVQIPKCPSSISAEKLLKQLNRTKMIFGSRYSCEVSLVEIVDGRLGYIVRHTRACNLTGESKAENPVFEKSREDFHEHFERTIDRISPDFTDSASSDHFGELPVELWLEVFSHLDTMTQTALRVVCPGWNSILESPTLTANILITNSGSNKKKSSGRLEYDLLSPIFKCLTASTQRIVVVNQRRLMEAKDFLLNVPQMIHYVAVRNGGIHLKTVHWVNLQYRLVFGNRYDHVGYNQCVLHRGESTEYGKLSLSAVGLHDFIELCRDLPCKAVQLNGCTVLLEWTIFGGSPSELRLHLLNNSPKVKVKTLPDFGCEMWDVLEAALPALSSEQLETLSEWLQSHTALQNADSKSTKIICKALCATQTVDPRLSSHYREKQWCIEGLQNLKMEKLSHLTQHFCIKLAKLQGI